ncbi:MAG: hypothetical protein ACYC0V_00280 [Armatimonadota bacterium]
MILTTLVGLAAGIYCIKTAKEIGLGGICKVAKKTITDARDNVRIQLEKHKTEKTASDSDVVINQLLDNATPEEKALIQRIVTRKEDASS